MKIDAVCNYWRGSLKLYWSSDVIGKTLIPASFLRHLTSEAKLARELVDFDNDGLSDYYEKNISLSDHTDKDSDADGLSDGDEVNIYLTDVNNKDSDSDGIDDYQEAIIYCSLNDDVDREVVEVLSLLGRDAIAWEGDWQIDNNSLVSNGFRGNISYEIDFPHKDMYLLEVNAGPKDVKSFGKPFELELYVDDHYINTQTIIDNSSYKNANYGLQFEGGLDIQREGIYFFKLCSDDGSQLFIDGELIVDNDGLHSALEKSGSVFLSPGVHSVIVNYFNKSGDSQLMVALSDDGYSYQSISSSHLIGDLNWRYYEGIWDSMPHYEGMTPLKSGSSVSFNLDARIQPLHSSATYCLPMLKEGKHSIRINWENSKYNKHLKVDSLTFKKIESEDVNSNGIKDWIDIKVSQECTFNDISSSKTSPACIEGKALFPELMSISTGAEVLKSNNQQWYANLTLDHQSEVDFTISFQNQAKVLNRKISWERTYIPNELEIIKIRKGDSLLLDPNPENSTAPGNIMIDNKEYVLGENKALPYLFDKAGEYEVTSLYKNNKGETSNHTMIVDVVEVDLPDTTISGLVGNERKISFLSNIPDEVSVDADERLSSWYVLPNGTTAFSLDSVKERYVLARIGKNGPIIDRMKLQGIRFYGAGITSFIITDTLADGTSIMNLKAVSLTMQSDIRIKVWIYLAGVTFDDGSTDVYLTQDDFSSINEKELIFIKSPEARKTAGCHHVEIYQDGSYLGRAY
ncbi:MAG: hypothetical protein HQL32_04705 [Planctomycetes bacterium]|nr:hypothetical protein [Planctomycetota bacterium]